jgi:phosphate transport system protein
MRLSTKTPDNVRGQDSSPAAVQSLLSTMFDKVDEQLADSLNVLQRRDDRLADLVRRRDDDIDRLEMQIDRAAMQILLSRPEDPSTIRFVVSAIKVNTDLERIGDHCKNIAKASVRLSTDELRVHMKYFDAMIVAARSMLFAAQDALFSRDLEKAWELVLDGHVVGRLHSRTLDTIMDLDAPGAYGDSFKTGARLYALSKSLERIADHSVNIAESVLFWADGIDVRHHRGADSLLKRNITPIGVQDHETDT